MRAQTILEVGRGRPDGPAIDLGDVAVFPGWVNAHTHLEFSDIQTPIGRPGVPLEQWITMVIAARAGSDASTRDAAIASGLAESTRSGVRLIGEITTPPCVYPEQDSAPEIVSFAEVLGQSPSRYRERIDAAAQHNRTTAGGGYSPHAPYSTSLAAIDRCVQMASTSNRPLAMHVAESPAERELITLGSGPMADVLKQLGVWQDGIFPWSSDPMRDLIERLAAAPRGLLIHGNDLRDDEVSALSGHANLSVVYCPRTHAFFQHDRHPVDRMLARGVRVALGTDSRASNPDLNLWNEVRFLLDHRQDLDPAAVLRMATADGADALGRPDLGRIESGSTPGLVAVPTSAGNLDQIYRDLSDHQAAPIVS